MNKEEIWRDIAGYEGLYQVSDMGRVKSLERTLLRSRSRKKKNCLRLCVEIC